jgi:GDP-4-dehydro-6-deoxy-D-mannose reductase
MSGLAGLQVRVETDPELLRPAENRAVVGDIRKIAAAVGWRPEIELERSLADLLQDWMGRC